MSEASARAFSDLDQIDTQILSVYHDPSELDVVKYLGIISVSQAHGDLAEAIEEMQWRKVN